MLFGLLWRKDEDVYLRLLLKIEEMATARNAKIFNRKVRVMCDFERAFINAVSKKIQRRCDSMLFLPLREERTETHNEGHHAGQEAGWASS